MLTVLNSYKKFTLTANISCTWFFANPFEQFVVYAADAFFECPLAEYTTPTVAFHGWFIQGLLAVVGIYASLEIRSAFNGIFRRFFATVQSIVRDNLQATRQQYFPVVLFLFLFIFSANLLGMFPISITITSSLAFTSFLALLHYAGANIAGIARSGWRFGVMFLPAGLPLAISLLLIMIELISYIARGFSLSIRLFANMFAGHVLLKLMSTLAVACLITAPIIAALVWGLSTPIIALELLVAFLQAYVFSLLVALYINDPYAAHSDG